LRQSSSPHQLHGTVQPSQSGRAAHVKTAGLTEGLEEAIQEDLRLTFFVAGDVFLTPRGEFGEFFPARHGRVLPENRQIGKDGASARAPDGEKTP